jgi:hypothetical protein
MQDTRDITLKEFKDYIDNLINKRPDLSDKYIIFSDGKGFHGLESFGWDKENLQLIDWYSVVDEEENSNLYDKGYELFNVNDY